MADVVLLNPHERMTPQDCLNHCSRDHETFQDCIVVGYDKDGDLVIRSSEMSRQEAVFMLLAAIDYARGLS